MAKFKKNDLITDGRTIWWITGVTDTHYIFTEQDQTTISRPIKDIDGRFSLWQSKQVWHKGNEPADEDKEILFEWESLGEKYHDVGFYDKKAKVAYVINGGRLVLSPEDRWAYLEDLTQL